VEPNVKPKVMELCNCILATRTPGSKASVQRALALQLELANVAFANHKTWLSVLKRALVMLDRVTQ